MDRAANDAAGNPRCAISSKEFGPSIDRVCWLWHALPAGAYPWRGIHGPASTPDGLADLKRWAANLPRNREIVIYCGCCPFAHCPNIRPAFTALQEMGFKSIRVLVLETGLGQDWVEKGAERGYLTDRHGNS